MFFPVRPGVLMVGRWRPGAKYADGVESYLLANDGDVTSIGRFWIDRYGTSPNGCRVAHRNSRCHRDNSESADKAIPRIGCWTAQIIDFCRKGETK
jgi:hypothetical protein